MCHDWRIDCLLHQQFFRGQAPGVDYAARFPYKFSQPAASRSASAVSPNGFRGTSNSDSGSVRVAFATAASTVREGA